MTAVQTDTKITNPNTDAGPNGVASGVLARSMPHMASWIASYNRNIAALSAVNQVAIEGAHALVRRQLEMAQEIAGAGIADLQAVASTPTAWTKPGEQAELMKRSYQRAVSTGTELADLVQRSNCEIASLIGERLTGLMDEMTVCVGMIFPLAH